MKWKKCWEIFWLSNFQISRGKSCDLRCWDNKTMWVLRGQIVWRLLWLKECGSRTTVRVSPQQGGGGCKECRHWDTRDCPGAGSMHSLNQNEEGALNWGNYRLRLLRTSRLLLPLTIQTLSETQGSEGALQRSVFLESTHRRLKTAWILKTRLTFKKYYFAPLK